MLLGIIYGLIPVLTFTQGLLTGQKSIQRASEAEEKSVWITALQMDRFFRQKKMDQLFREYRDKVKQQRQNGQIVSDLEDILNEDVLALYSWQGVVAQIPGTLTGLGILGTFIGLLRGLRNINFVTVEAALSSVQSILTGIDTAFYTSIAGVILSILFNISNNILRNTMDREMGIFLEVFHRVVFLLLRNRNATVPAERQDRSWICWTVCQRKMIIQLPVWGQLQTQPLEMSVF